MLNEAQKNCLRNNLTANVDLVRPDCVLSNVSGTFDFVVSLYVFQHIPPPRGEAILKAILNRLDAGGIGALHFTYFRRASRAKYMAQWMRRYVPFANNFVNLLIRKKPLFYPLMQWHNYDLNKIYSVLQAEGCAHSYVRFTDHGGHLGAMLFFQKKALQPLESF